MDFFKDRLLLHRIRVFLVSSVLVLIVCVACGRILGVIHTIALMIAQCLLCQSMAPPSASLVVDGSSVGVVSSVVDGCLLGVDVSSVGVDSCLLGVDDA